MSKLADKIRKAARLEQASIGFGAARSASDPTMVLAAQVKDAAAASDALKRGADAVVLGSHDKSASTNDGAAVKDAAAGAWISGDADAKTLKDAGFDFVVFDPDKTASTAVLEENIGYVMRLPKDVAEQDLRAIADFQLDAIDIGRVDGNLTVRKQIELRRAFAYTRKPLMAAVSPDISARALQALRDTNVAVVVAEDAAAVEKLRKTIDALPPRSRRKDDADRPTPLVPRSAGGDHDHEDDDDD